MKLAKLLRFAVSSFAAVALAGFAYAADAPYPTKPIRILVGYPPGWRRISGTNSSRVPTLPSLLAISKAPSLKT